MRSLYICGPGRSGTSVMAAQLSGVPGIFYPGFEQKVFSETDGLTDVLRNATVAFSPNRGWESARRLRYLWVRAVKGWQDSARSAEEHQLVHDALMSAIDVLCSELPAGMWTGNDLATARGAILEFQRRVALAIQKDPVDFSIYLDDTPQALTGADSLLRLAPDSLFLEVVRDPRRVAASITAMPWGPDDLAGAIKWVADYARMTRRMKARIPQDAVLRLKLEEISGNRDHAAEQLSDFLGLHVSADVLSVIANEQANARAPLDAAIMSEAARTALSSVNRDWGYS